MKTPREEKASTEKSRMFYIDNIRIYLTLLVVLHHISIGYGGAGDWIIKEPPTDSISPIILTLFNALNQSYFMSLFFLLSGYFVPSSLDKKGAIRFFKDRLIRLGLPIIVFALLFARIVDYVVLNHVYHLNLTAEEVFSRWIKSPTFYTGPLWFVEVLLYFSLIYMLWRLFWSKLIFKNPPQLFLNRFPPNPAIITAITALSIGTYFIRIWYPVGTIWVHYQLGHYVHYAFCFVMGICAFRGNWLSKLTPKIASIWRLTALLAIISLPLTFVLMMSFGVGIDAAMGRGTGISFVVAAWESVSCLSIIIWILQIFKTRLNSRKKISQALSPNAYTVYIIHQPLVGIVMAVFLYLTLPSIVKFVLVSLISILLCFLTSHFILRKLPFAKRVLG